MKVKTYSLEDMKDRDMINLFKVIHALGYGPESFRIVYFGSHSREMKVIDQELHWTLKSLSKLTRLKSSDKRKIK